MSFGVNQDTMPMAPPEGMQFGITLPRLLQALAYTNPKFGPVHIAKCDLLDSFHHLQLSLDSIPPLAVPPPKSEGEDPLVAMSLVVAMG